MVTNCVLCKVRTEALYCDMSTHCWVTQQWMQPASKRQQGKQISAHAWWRHTATVGDYHVTSTFPQVTSHTLPLRPLPRNVAVNNLTRNNMGKCVFSVVRAQGLSWRLLERLKQLAVSGRQFPSEYQTLRTDRMEYWRVRNVSCVNV
jgi:hypothetical protein